MEDIIAENKFDSESESERARQDVEKARAQKAAREQDAKKKTQPRPRDAPTTPANGQPQTQAQRLEQAKAEREAQIKSVFEKHKGALLVATPIPDPVMYGGLFRCGFVNFVFSEPGIGKTYLAARWICDLSVGGPIFGGNTEFLPRKSVYIAGESGADYFQKAIQDARWNASNDNAAVYDHDALRNDNQEINLSTPEGRETFEILLEIEKSNLVWLDSFMDFAGADERDSAFMTPVIQFLCRMAKKHNIAIVLMHHMRKRKTAERNQPLSLDDMIGSSVFTRYAAYVYALEWDRGADEGVRIVRCLKYRGKRTEEFRYKVFCGDMVIVDTPKAISRVNSIISRLAEIWNKDEQFTIKEVKENLDAVEFKKFFGGNERRIFREMVDAGRLEVIGTQGKASVYRLI